MPPTVEGIGLLFLLPFCFHNTQKQGGTRRRTTHHQTTWNCLLPNAFPTRSEGYRSWPCCTHNPKVAGSNPAPATMDDEGLAVFAADPFVVSGPVCTRCTASAMTLATRWPFSPADRASAPPLHEHQASERSSVVWIEAWPSCAWMFVLPRKASVANFLRFSA